MVVPPHGASGPASGVVPAPPSRLSVWLFHGVAALAAVLLVVPLVLTVSASPFPGRRLGVAVFLLAVLDRVWAMYLRPGIRHEGGAAGRDWTALAVGYAYTLTLGVAAVEFLVRRCGLPAPFQFVAGCGLYALAVAVRYWAFAVLRSQWHVDVTDVSGERHLVRAGPYQFVRHPLYAGACLEAVALPLLLGTPVALALGLLVFSPLEIIRARYEERFLRTLFGVDYERYAEDVPAFLPRPFGGRRRSSGQPTGSACDR